MATTAQVRTPVHLWIVGIVALLWNAIGCYDYLMTRMRNTDYFEKMMPGYLNVLESILTARDRKGIVEEGHKIKGAAGSVGLRHLQQLGQQIQSPDLPAWEDNVGEWVEEMKQEWQNDVAVLKAWVESRKK